MADVMTAAQRAAELAAQQREEEEREREREERRAAIRFQIQQCNTKIARVNSQISDLSAEQSKLNAYLGDWNVQKNIYSGNDILSEVVIVNVFEGVCADRVKEDFSSCIREMDQTCGRVNGLNGNVSAQIARLIQYKAFINTKLTSLNNELNSI